MKNRSCAPFLSALLLLLCLSAGAAAQETQSDAQWAEGSLDYLVAYSASDFSFTAYRNADVLQSLAPPPADDYPAVFVSVSQLTDTTMEEAMNNLRSQSGVTGTLFQGELGGHPTLEYHFAQGEQPNSRVCEYTAVQKSDGSLLLIEMDFYPALDPNVKNLLYAVRDSITPLDEGESASRVQAGSSEDDASAFRPQLIQCPTCGGWFEEGDAFRNHVCQQPEASAIPVYVQCPICGEWVEEGELENHVCATPAP